MSTAGAHEYRVLMRPVAQPMRLGQGIGIHHMLVVKTTSFGRFLDNELS